MASIIIYSFLSDIHSAFILQELHDGLDVLGEVLLVVYPQVSTQVLQSVVVVGSTVMQHLEVLDVSLGHLMVGYYLILHQVEDDEHQHLFWELL